MKKMVQSYLVFTSRAYQIVSLVILPALFLVLSLILFPRHGQGNGIYPENYFGAYVITFEIVSDFRVFGGVCNKENKGLEYMKTSKRGLSILQKGMVGDLIRRFIYMLGYGCICAVWSGNLQNIVSMLVAYTIAVLSFNLTRYMMIWQIQMLLAMGAAVLYEVAFFLCWLVAQNRIGHTVLFVEMGVGAVLAVVASIVTLWHMMHRMKGSYYEK